MSALIFVSLALAWAVYLIPKALKHHDEVVRSRSVERFSATMRVLARREPINRRDARLVLAPGRQAAAPTVEIKASSVPPARAAYPARREAVRKATKRRRTVLGAILVVNATVIAVASASLVAWPFVSAPAVLLVVWLVACRVMVKGERAAARPFRVEVAGVLPETADSPIVADVQAETVEPAVPAVPDRAEDAVPDRAEGAVPDRAEGAVPDRARGAWDLMPTTLPTYVSKPAAVRRTVQTIDLDSTGVWSSGRNSDDSLLAREAEEAGRAERAERAEAERRATGS